ncbi:MAG TPA: choice-of-anchor J domain-containing protein, partial [Flavisolibacter sp.]|nr:choice-of-anchor J domain-containing protein [Flavisolibacter sp.]
GVAEFQLADPTIALQGSGTADAPHIILYVSTLGTTGIRVQYKLRDIDGTADNSVQPVALQYRIGTSGNFVNVPSAFVADATTGPGLATQVTDVDVILPAAADNQEQVQIRIITTNAAGNDEWVGIDDISVSASTTGSDVTPPAISSLYPSDNAAYLPINTTATITFNETVQKGNGKIYIKRAADDVVAQTIDVASSAVSVSGNQVLFALSLANSTAYYIQVDAGAFKDIAGNNFAGISGPSTWNFTTVAPPADGVLGKTYTFNTCSNYINEGFQTYSVGGAQTWTCTKFGRTYIADPSSDSAIEINGFSGTSIENEDWLISPKFDLTGTGFPLLDFYSRSRFAGPSLSLKVSTNYTGSGDPSLATWTTVFAAFPTPNSNVWTLTDSVNLSAFKGSNVHIAWVYTSTAAAASRWTLDDITIYNSPVPPAPSATVTDRLLDFRHVTAGSVSESRTVHFYATDLTSPLTITAPAGYQLSKDGSSYSTSITFNEAEAGSGLQTFFVQFAPDAANTVYTGTLRLSSTGINTEAVILKGNSYPFDLTLNVVNWNIEWFGSTSNGPSNEALQQANAKKVMDALDADVYAVAEIVNPASFASLIGSLDKSYSYVIGNYCSGSSSNCNTSQKLAFAYKTDVVSNVKARPLMITSATARANWASGRVPFLVTADVTKNGLTKTINFIVVHAKANTGQTADQIESYYERKAGVQELKDTLDSYFADANIVMLGDYNDDLDRTIAPTTGEDTVSSYQILVADSTDENHYRAVTLPLSYAGLASTAENPDVIDHVVISDELHPSYVNLSATLYNDIATVAGITDYTNTTSDHFPVMTRYVFCKPACPADILVRNDAGKCGAAVIFDLEAASACGTATAVPASGSFFPLGTTTVKVTTSYGEKCSFTVTVEDREKPAITCQPEKVVNPASLSGTAVTYDLPSATDNCGTPVVRQTAGLPSGATFPIGTTVNTFEATDASGNTSTCSFA